MDLSYGIDFANVFYDLHLDPGGARAMSDRHVYEVEGVRQDGSAFTVEILGRHSEGAALSLARHYARLWNATVRLYRVPFNNTGKAAWAEDETQFVCFTSPDRAGDRRRA
jgi:hypothetical protein